MWEGATGEHAALLTSDAHLEVCITVLSAQNPKVDDPFVRVEVFDFGRTAQSATTVTCECNNLNPYWGSITTFPVSRIDTALVRFALYDDDPTFAAPNSGGGNRGVVGQYTASLASISSGLRYIPMESFNGSRLEKCTLFVKVEFKPIAKGGLLSRVGLAKPPAQRLQSLLKHLIVDSSTRRANSCPPMFMECVHALSVSMAKLIEVARACHPPEASAHHGDALAPLAVATMVHRMVDQSVGVAGMLTTQPYTPQKHPDLLPSAHAHVTPHTAAAVLFALPTVATPEAASGCNMVGLCNAFQHSRVQVCSLHNRHRQCDRSGCSAGERGVVECIYHTVSENQQHNVPFATIHHRNDEFHLGGEFCRMCFHSSGTVNAIERCVTWYT